MKNRILLIAILVIFASSYFLGAWLKKDKPITYNVIQMKHMPCNPVETTCIAEFDQGKAELMFTNQPSALMPFGVKVRLETDVVDRVVVDFTMPDMNMGINRFSLDKKEDNNWSKEIVLPVCSLGRNVWVVQLQLLQGSTQWVADFSFTQNPN